MEVRIQAAELRERAAADRSVQKKVESWTAIWENPPLQGRQPMFAALYQAKTLHGMTGGFSLDYLARGSRPGRPFGVLAAALAFTTLVGGLLSAQDPEPPTKAPPPAADN